MSTAEFPSRGHVYSIRDAHVRGTTPDWSDASRLIRALQALSHARTIDEVQAVVAHGARELGSADGATFVLRERDNCFYADEDAIGPLWKGQRFPMSACISGWAMAHKETVSVEDIYSDARIPIDAYAPTFVKSLLMVPIRQDDPIGAVGIYWARRHRPTPAEVHLLEMLTQATALAIENITLLNELELRVSERTSALAAALEETRITGEKLRHAEKMEAVGTLAVGVAHNFNNILQAVLGNVSLARLRSSDEETMSKSLDAAVASIRRAAALTEQLLDFSDQQVNAEEKVDLTELVSKAEVLLRPVIGDHIALHTSAPASPLFIQGDRRLFEQLLQLVADNAREAMPDGGTLTIALHAAEDGLSATLSIADTGHGMSRIIRQRAFDPFFSTKGFGSGRATGMGLPIAWGIVKRHGGEITLESETGEGTTVTVQLPLCS